MSPNQKQAQHIESLISQDWKQKQKDSLFSDLFVLFDLRTEIFFMILEWFPSFYNGHLCLSMATKMAWYIKVVVSIFTLSSLTCVYNRLFGSV